MDLSHERFLRVLDSLKGEDAFEPERRQQPRIGARASTAVLIAPCGDATGRDSQGEPGPAYAVRVQDLGPGGIAVQHFRALPRGQTFIVDLPERGDGDVGGVTSLRMLCRVTHCRTTAEHQFVIGAQFVRLWTGPAASLEAARAAA